MTWRQFRHIHSSLLNDLRLPVKIAQEQLGHASISTTLNIYTHVVDASHRGERAGSSQYAFRSQLDCMRLAVRRSGEHEPFLVELALWSL